MRANERPPLCAICGHVKAKHVESLMSGHVVCRAKNCQCTLYQLPENWKTTAEYGVAYIGKDDKCNNCGHFYREHTQVDDREKAQTHWPCMRCDCKDYDFWSDKNVEPKEPSETFALDIDSEDVCGICSHLYREHNAFSGHCHGIPQLGQVCICPGFNKGTFSVNDRRRMLGVDKVENDRGSWEDDPVNHPSHYTAYPGIEVIQLTRHMSFNRGNAVKYTARAGLKNKDTEVQDLEKAIWYLQDEVKLLKGEHDA